MAQLAKKITLKELLDENRKDAPIKLMSAPIRFTLEPSLLPDIYVNIDANLIENVETILSLNINTQEGSTNAVSGGNAVERITGILNSYYTNSFIQDVSGNYLVDVLVDNNYNIGSDLTFNTIGDFRSIVLGSEIINVGGDQVTTIAGTEYLNVGQDLETTTGNNSLVEVANNLLISTTSDSNLLYTGRDAILNVGGDEITTVGGNQKYYVSGSDSVNVANNSNFVIAGYRTEDISGNETVTVGGNYISSVKNDSNVTVGVSDTVIVGGDCEIDVKGNDEDIIGVEYNLTTPHYIIDANTKIIGSLNGNTNGSINVSNTNGGEIKAGGWFPIPWSSVSVSGQPGITFDQVNNKFMVTEDGNYSFNSFVNFNSNLRINGVTRIRVSCCCGETILLGSGVSSYTTITSSFINSSALIDAGTCVYFEYFSTVSGAQGFDQGDGTLSNSLTITKL